jgi:hypothetical protein
MRHAPKRNRALDLLGPVLLCALLFGAGMLAQGHLDDGTAAGVRASTVAELQRDHEACDLRVAHANETMQTEREHHASENSQRHTSNMAFAAHAARVRDNLQTELDGARREGGACTGRIAAISGDLAELVGLLDEGASLVGEGRSEIKRLESENSRLAEQVRAWQQRYRDTHIEQILVTAPKK